MMTNAEMAQVVVEVMNVMNAMNADAPKATAATPKGSKKTTSRKTTANASSSPKATKKTTANASSSPKATKKTTAKKSTAKQSDGDLKFEVKDAGTILSENGNFRKRISLVSWNGGDPKWDLRTWHINEAGEEEPRKGVTLTADELAALYEAIGKVLES